MLKILYFAQCAQDNTVGCKVCARVLPEYYLIELGNSSLYVCCEFCTGLLCDLYPAPPDMARSQPIADRFVYSRLHTRRMQKAAFQQTQVTSNPRVQHPVLQQSSLPQHQETKASTLIYEVHERIEEQEEPIQTLLLGLHKEAKQQDQEQRRQREKKEDRTAETKAQQEELQIRLDNIAKQQSNKTALAEKKGNQAAADTA